VQDVIVRNIPIIEPDTPIELAAEMLIDVGLPVLPVMDSEELVGVVSRRDIEDVFMNISQRRPSLDEVEKWVSVAKKHKPLTIR
jgi:predicted transcriptional regulator